MDVDETDLDDTMMTDASEYEVLNRTPIGRAPGTPGFQTPPGNGGPRRPAANRPSSGTDANPAYWAKIAAGVGALVAAVALMVVFLSSTTTRLPFCSNDGAADVGDAAECTPCPAQADCSNSVAVCHDGFILSGEHCVEDGHISILSHGMMEMVRDIVHGNAGEFICGTSTRPTPVTSRGELNETLLVSDDFRTLAHSSIGKYNKALERAMNMIRLNLVRYDMEVVEVTLDDGSSEFAYASTKPALNLSCRLGQSARNNIPLLLLLAAVAIGALVVAVRISARRQVDQLYARIIDAARVQREDNEDDKKASARISLSHMRDEFAQTSGRKAIDSIWPLIEDKIQNDSRISRLANNELEYRAADLRTPRSSRAVDPRSPRSARIYPNVDRGL